MRDGRLLKYDILDSELPSSGEIRVKVGDRATGVGIADNCSLWGSDGFISRPNDPTDDGACLALVHEDGSTRRVLVTKDNRFLDAYATLNEGDRAIVTDGDARFLLKKADASLNWYTKTDAGDTMLVQLSGDAKAFTVMVGGSSGTAMIQMKSGELTLSCGGSASIVLKGGNVTIHGDLFWAATGRGVLGQIAGIAPPPGAQSVLAGPQGQVGVPSSSWTVAP